MEKKVMQTYLYDFYGELLTEHQRMIYEDFVLNDLSLSEIAQEEGISRQGVHDLVKRCDKLLENYEGKMHLLERFLNTKEKITKIRTLAQNYQNKNEAIVMAEIAAISSELLEEL
ncbi:MAG: YlxM family DNA-binding protein [Lachnospiraceae bacterium]